MIYLKYLLLIIVRFINLVLITNKFTPDLENLNQENPEEAEFDELLTILSELKNESDVRGILKKKFNLRERQIAAKLI